MFLIGRVKCLVSCYCVRINGPINNIIKLITLHSHTLTITIYAYLTLGLNIHFLIEYMYIYTFICTQLKIIEVSKQVLPTLKIVISKLPKAA